MNHRFLNDINDHVHVFFGNCSWKIISIVPAKLGNVTMFVVRSHNTRVREDIYITYIMVLRRNY